MKFVFNDSLAASVSVSETELTDIRFVPSGIILEKKIVTSATINNIDELFDAVKGFKTEAELENFLNTNSEAQALLKDNKNLVKFTRKMSGMFGNTIYQRINGEWTEIEYNERNNSLIEKINPEILSWAN
jgi:hypothetical protein